MDFPGRLGACPDGRAYFAKDRWIAEEFAARQLQGYEDFVIEVAIPRIIYEESFQNCEQPVVLGTRQGVQLVIPAAQLDVLNESGTRRVAGDVTT